MMSLKTSTKLFYFLSLVNLYALEISRHAVGNNDVIMPFLGTVMEEMLIAALIYHNVEYKGFLLPMSWIISTINVLAHRCCRYNPPPPH